MSFDLFLNKQDALLKSDPLCLGCTRREIMLLMKKQGLREATVTREGVLYTVIPEEEGVKLVWLSKLPKKDMNRHRPPTPAPYWTLTWS